MIKNNLPSIKYIIIILIIFLFINILYINIQKQKIEKYISNYISYNIKNIVIDSIYNQTRSVEIREYFKFLNEDEMFTNIYNNLFVYLYDKKIDNFVIKYRIKKSKINDGLNDIVLEKNMKNITDRKLKYKKNIYYFVPINVSGFRIGFILLEKK